MNKFLQNLIVAFALALFIFFTHNEPSISNTLEFVQVSDIHYSTTRANTTYKLLERSRDILLDVIAQINEMKNVDFVMITGDAIDQPIKSSAEDVFTLLNTMKYPWYMALGNHDTTTSGTLTKQCLLSVVKNYNTKFVFDKWYYSFVPKQGFKVIVLDGAKNSGVSSNGNIPADELSWLDNELKSTNKNDAVIIFMHFPLYEPFPSPHHKIINSDELYKVLDKYNRPIALFTGHYHTTKIKQEGHLLHVSTPSLVCYPDAFRSVKVVNSKKQVEYDIKFHETRLTDAQRRAKMLTFGSSSYYGTDSDRNTVILMDK
ncbi:MAG: metallophosphoesterase [Candidatus Gastranaerophilales bacterium]|nr:metallophosphoesterase [Candidatus Gastranaerophilales bacterium]